MRPAPFARVPVSRRLLLLPAGLALLAGMWAGLLRIGWDLQLGYDLAERHGGLMVVGFVGTVIALERAVALARPSAYVAPLAGGLSGIALLFGAPAGVPPLLATIAGLGLAGIFAAFLRRHAALPLYVMGAGALVWAAGNALWLAGTPVRELVPWWAGFLVLTIAGERLELARFLRLSSVARSALVLACAAIAAGLLVSLADFDAGARLAGVSSLAVAAWIVRYDVVRGHLRRDGLPRFVAAGLLAGYAWLAVGGVLAAAGGLSMPGPRYDATVHAIFLGFVFSAIIAHAPIILPAVTGMPVAWWRGLYAPLILLHASLALRVFGDLAPWADGRRWGGMLNVIALIGFLLAMGVAAWRARAPRGETRRVGRHA